MIDVTHICICLDYPKLYTNMATGNDVTSHENDLKKGTGSSQFNLHSKPYKWVKKKKAHVTTSSLDVCTSGRVHNGINVVCVD